MVGCLNQEYFTALHMHGEGDNGNEQVEEGGCGCVAGDGEQGEGVNGVGQGMCKWR